MLRNIRRFYWKQRDRGQGRKTVMAVLVFFMFVAIIVAAKGRKGKTSKKEGCS